MSAQGYYAHSVHGHWPLNPPTNQSRQPSRATPPSIDQNGYIYVVTAYPATVRNDATASRQPHASRPPPPQKPEKVYQCFDHGCDGRSFSNVENFKRHLKEKSGSSTVVCNLCGKAFTRKSNMEKHVVEGKCGFMKGIAQDLDLASNDLGKWQSDPWGADYRS